MERLHWWVLFANNTEFVICDINKVTIVNLWKVKRDCWRRCSAYMRQQKSQQTTIGTLLNTNLIIRWKKTILNLLTTYLVTNHTVPVMKTNDHALCCLRWLKKMKRRLNLNALHPTIASVVSVVTVYNLCVNNLERLNQHRAAHIKVNKEWCKHFLLLTLLLDTSI